MSLFKEIIEDLDKLSVKILSRTISILKSTFWLLIFIIVALLIFNFVVLFNNGFDYVKLLQANMGLLQQLK